MTRVNILHKGDQVLNVTSDFVAVKRKSGEVDIIPLIREETGWRVDQGNIVTIGFGDNTISTQTEDGVTITNF